MAKQKIDASTNFGQLINRFNQLSDDLGDLANISVGENSDAIRAINSKLALSGGTMAGNINMGANDISNIGDLTSAGLSVSGTFTFGGTVITSTATEINKLDGFTGTVADLNYAKDLRATGVTVNELDILDGITSTTAELNKLNGFTGTVNDLNYAKDLRATGVTVNELGKLDGFTGTVDDLNYAKDLRATGVTVSELDKLDGFTGTVADLNYAKDLRATGVTTVEFNKLDGLTATTVELNYTDGVTSAIQTQLNTKATSASPTLTGNIQLNGNVGLGGTNYGTSGQYMVSQGAGSAPSWETLTIPADNIRGYIAFDGSTGAVIKSLNLSLSKIGTGNYEITCDASIRDGTTNWGVVITNVDDGTRNQAPQVLADDATRLYNAFLMNTTTTGFKVRARTTTNTHIFGGGNDNNDVNTFGISAVDPTYIALLVF